jgi:prophage regulatory protein
MNQNLTRPAPERIPRAASLAPDPGEQRRAVARATEEGPILLTVIEVSRLLGISVRSVWRLASSGDLPGPISIGRSKRWSRRVLEAYVEQKAQSSIPD